MPPHEEVQIRIFDLNCWALRFLSKKRKERLALIGQLLQKKEFDLVMLQEIWSDVDYIEMKHSLSDVFPHSHRFKSGVIGSGLCVFSRFPIIDCLQYQFSLNGFPYMVTHGDWFCGKGVGLVKLVAHGFLCHVYITHLHAEYCREKDCYKSHRILQSWELAQFIRHTSSGSDVVLLGGDLNMHPDDLGTKLLREWTELKDAYTECAEYEGPPGGCTLLPTNPYTESEELRNFPQGIRIDYIMYKTDPEVAATCHLVTTGSGLLRKTPPFSDHEIVTATLRLQRTEEISGPRRGTPNSVISAVFSECCSELYTGLRSAENWRNASYCLVVLLLLFLVLQCSSSLLSIMGVTLSPTPSILLTLILLILSFISLVLHTAEQRQLQNVRDEMSLIEHGLRAKRRAD
ncbi:sphingomyelin phosphodiesterase 2 [Rhinophrynus dorsalis]